MDGRLLGVLEVGPREHASAEAEAEDDVLGRVREWLVYSRSTSCAEEDERVCQCREVALSSRHQLLLLLAAPHRRADAARDCTTP